VRFIVVVDIREMTTQLTNQPIKQSVNQQTATIFGFDNSSLQKL
jgi:hypothetical protein